VLIVINIIDLTASDKRKRQAELSQSALNSLFPGVSDYGHLVTGDAARSRNWPGLVNPIVWLAAHGQPNDTWRLSAQSITGCWW